MRTALGLTLLALLASGILGSKLGFGEVTTDPADPEARFYFGENKTNIIYSEIKRKLGFGENTHDPSDPEARFDCFCISLFEPVCGDDGQTYSNSCKAGCDRVEIACEGECPCIFIGK